MWATETALVRNKSSRLFLRAARKDVESVSPKLCTAYQSVLLTGWLLGTRQRSESDDTGTRVKIRLHSIMGRVTFSFLLSE